MKKVFLFAKFVFQSSINHSAFTRAALSTDPRVMAVEEVATRTPAVTS